MKFYKGKEEKIVKGRGLKSRDREEEKTSVNKVFQQKDWQIRGSRWITGGFMWIEYTCSRCTYLGISSFLQNLYSYSC